MFYRRKILLALLQLFDGQLDKIRLQKLLFLFTKRQGKTEYDFIPYKYGCYSYTANADLLALTRKSLIEDEGQGFKLADETDYFKSLKETDKALLRELKILYGKMSGTALMKHTYINYPFYAINSVRATDILNEQELEKVNKAKPKTDDTTLFTIGYEGISLEEYINRLIKNDVKVLVDVRNNPLSMKFGFSKSQIKKYCESVGIQYMHFPEVGIQSEQRQELNTQQDYDILFSEYKKTNLLQTTSTQKNILELLRLHKRIALTCFEANICQCHRKPLAESIASLKGFEYDVKHI